MLLHRQVRDVCVAPEALDVCVYDCMCLRLCPHDSCWLVVTCGLAGTLKLWDGREGLFIRDVTKRDVEFVRCALSHVCLYMYI